MNISDLLDDKELLCQLAEEAAELSQAALKLRRAIDGKNPTPKTFRECKSELNEEIADVRLCLEELTLFSDADFIIQDEIVEYKRRRWLSRLLARKDV